MTFCAAGIPLVLSLAWFVGAVVVPVWQVKSGIARVGWVMSGPVTHIPGGKELIAELGGSASASTKLELYLRMPKMLASERLEAIEVLAEIDPPAKGAIPILERLLKDEDELVSMAAASTLKKIRDEERE